jgi:hypothetical protein
MSDPAKVEQLRYGIRAVVEDYPDVNVLDKVRALRDAITEWQPPFADSAEALAQRLWEVIEQEKNRAKVLDALIIVDAKLAKPEHDAPGGGNE